METGINGDEIGGDVNQQRRIGSLCIYKCRYIYSLPNCLAKIPRQSGGLYTVYIYSISICTLEAYLLPNCLAKNTRQSGSLHIYIQIYIYTRSLTTYICIFFKWLYLLNGWSDWKTKWKKPPSHPLPLSDLTCLSQVQPKKYTQGTVSWDCFLLKSGSIS